MSVSTADVPEPLARHLKRAIGLWPPPPGVTVVENDARAQPGWDGRVHPVWGLDTGTGTVVGVAPGWHVGTDAAEFVARLAVGIFRWSTAPVTLEPAGIWVAAVDPRLPQWLVPFGHDVLVAFDDAGAYAGGVGLKHHDDDVWEIAVGTEPGHRGKGLARRLVAQAAATVLAAGAVPTYQHDLDNHASGKVAEAAGFPDHGWHFLVPPDPPDPL